MNKQELIEVIKNEPYEKGIFVDTIKFNRNWLLRKIEKLDEPEAGHADEAPRYVKNILARLRELPLHDREVWLKAIMGEFEKDFSHAKWREGYEQGKFEGVFGREKVKIPQFVAGWIEYCKRHNFTLFGCLDPVDGFERLVDENFEGDARKCIRWCRSASDKLARAWLKGYEVGVEEEKKYKIKLLNRNDGDLYLINQNADLANKYGHFSPVVLLFTKCTNFSKKCYELTKKEVVSHDFGWVFDCPGIKIEEVE